MRIKLKYKSNNNKFDFNNQKYINTFISNALGHNNKYHDKMSLYNISNLCGGVVMNNGKDKYLSFPYGAYIIISSLDDEFLSKIILNAFNEKHLIGLEFDGVEYINEHIYDGYNYFATLNPIILRKKIGKNNGKSLYKFLTPNDDEYVNLLTERSINKLKMIDPNINTKNFKINIIDFKIQKTMIKNNINTGVYSILKITSSKKIANILYNTGLGKSTGYGFGTIYKTENHNIYRNNKIIH